MKIHNFVEIPKQWAQLFQRTLDTIVSIANETTIQQEGSGKNSELYICFSKRKQDKIVSFTYDSVRRNRTK